MNCHVVPEAYLHTWKVTGSNNSIFLFDKNNTTNDGDQRNIRLKNTSFAVKDKYILDMQNSIYRSFLVDEYTKLHSTFIGYRYVFDGNNIRSITDFIEQFSHMSQWEIYNSSGDRVGNKKFINIVEQMWKRDISKKIEMFMSCNFESQWPDIVEYMDKTILGKAVKTVRSKNRDFLTEWMALQFCRKTDNIISLGINPAVDIFHKISKSAGIGDALSSLLDADFKESVALIDLYKYMRNYDTPNDFWGNNAIKKMKEIFYNYTIFLLISREYDFITSDNPCIHISRAEKFPPSVTGVYFPVTKRVCVHMVPHKTDEQNDKYLLIDISGATVAYINNLIRKKSDTSIAYSQNNISNNLISKQIDLAVWESYFHRHNLEHSK